MLSPVGRGAIAPTTRQRGAKWKKPLRWVCAVCFISAAAAAKTRRLRHGGSGPSDEFRVKRRTSQSKTNVASDAFECPPSLSGYYSTPDCRQYYWCHNGRFSSTTILSCSEGTLFDDMRSMCNWEEEVSCKAHLEVQGDTSAQEIRLTSSPTSEPTIFTECPRSHSGYYTTPGCEEYFWCHGGIRSSPIYSCTEGLLFDETLNICNWEAEVPCDQTARPTKAPSSQPTDHPTAPTTEWPSASPAGPSASPTLNPTEWSFRRRVTTHGKAIIGYWHGDNARSGSTSPDQVDYKQLTRVNYATFKASAKGQVYMKGKHKNPNTDTDVAMLFGPNVWNPALFEHLVEFCHSNPTNQHAVCTHHDSRRGMLHLAHLEGVEVYPSISLDEQMSLLRLDQKAFVANVIKLVEKYGFDGIDINFELPSGGEAEMQSGAAAIESLMSQLRHEIVKLMYRHGRYFGLTMNVPCQPEWIGRRDLLLSLNNLVDEFNLHTVDLNDAESSALAAPQAPLFADPAHSDAYRSVHSCLISYLVGGVPEDKINLGVSFYGRTYRGTSDMYTAHEGADASHWLWRGAGVDADGGVPYYGIYPMLQPGNQRVSLVTVRDDVTKSEFAFFDGNGIGKGLVSYENEWSLCVKAEYLMANELNGHFIWEVTGDILNDRSTPLLDLVNLKFSQPSLDCESYASEPASTTTSSTIANIEDDKEVSVERVTIKYGPPRYYPIFANKVCSDDERSRPSWATSGHMFQSKYQCCEQLFGSAKLKTCLGEGFVETNIIKDLTQENATKPPLPAATAENVRPPPPLKSALLPDTDIDTDTEKLGLCATQESEIPKVFRTAQVCGGDRPCPAGLSCFVDINLGYGE